MRQAVGFGDPSTRRGTFGANMGRPIVTNRDLRRSCAKVHDPSELQFKLVHALGRGITVLDRDPRGAKGRGSFGGF